MKKWAFDYHLEFNLGDGSGFHFPCNEHGVIDKSKLNPDALVNLEIAIRYKAFGCEVFILRTSWLNDEIVGERPWKTVQAKRPDYKYVPLD